MALEDEIAQTINDLEDPNFHWFMKGSYYAVDIMGRMGGMSSQSFVQNLIYYYMSENIDKRKDKDNA